MRAQSYNVLIVADVNGAFKTLCDSIILIKKFIQV